MSPDTLSTHPPILNPLDLAVAALVDDGRQARAEAERRAAERQQLLEAERSAQIEEAWRPLLAVIRDFVPAWVHDHIHYDAGDLPRSRYTSEPRYRFATISLPACTPIRAFSDGEQVCFIAEAWTPETDDGVLTGKLITAADVWSLDSRAIRQGCDHFAMVAAEAAHQHAQRPIADALLSMQLHQPKEPQPHQPEPEPKLSSSMEERIAAALERIADILERKNRSQLF